MHASSEADPYYYRIVCFGNFTANQPICLNRCGCRIRCAIATLENLKMEVLQDWVETDRQDLLSN